MSLFVNDIISGSAYEPNLKTKGNDELGKDAFLRLLTTQLRYQDPTNPSESSEFAAQLAQFSSLEQMTNMNNTIEESAEKTFAANLSMINTMAPSLLGKNVKAYTSELVVSDNTQPISFGMEAVPLEKNLKVEITDPNGTPVTSFILSKSELSDKSFEWDLTNFRGDSVSNGQYSIKVFGIDSDSTETEVPVYIESVIQRVYYTDSGARLIINGSDITMGAVREIYEED
jgi:flagellar basal-body rod modification protein FlgD